MNFGGRPNGIDEWDWQQGDSPVDPPEPEVEIQEATVISASVSDVAEMFTEEKWDGAVDAELEAIGGEGYYLADGGIPTNTSGIEITPAAKPLIVSPQNNGLLIVAKLLNVITLRVKLRYRL